MVVTADSVQMDARALGTVEELFREQMASGLHPGAGLCVYRRGVPVLDLCGGTANQGASKPVERDTMFRPLLVHQSPGRLMPPHPVGACEGGLGRSCRLALARVRPAG